MRMHHPHRYRGYLKVTSQIIFIFTLLTGLSLAQEYDPKIVSSLVDQLKQGDIVKRRKAANALGYIGEGAVGAVPQLVELLKDPDSALRGNAAIALGRIGEGAKGAAPQLIEALEDPDQTVRGNAAFALGSIGSSVPAAIVPQLIEALKDPDEKVRMDAAGAIGLIGEGAVGAVPRLVELLKDYDAGVRTSAAAALGHIGEGAKGAVPQLIEALEDPDAGVRTSAAYSLGSIGEGAEVAVPQLTEALKDPDEKVRMNAAYSLGSIGEGAVRAVPQLTEALKDPDVVVRDNAATALERLSTLLVRERATEFSEALNTVAGVMRDSPDPGVKRYADRVQQASDHLKLLWWEQLKQWVVANPTVSIVISTLPSLLLAWLILLWLHPLSLLHINEVLARTTDIKLPERLGGFNVAPRYLILAGFFHYHPRVLGAWVTKHVSSARKMFSGLPTVEERKIYVPLPVVLGDEAEAELSPDKLRPTLSGKLICLQIWGEGGAGKTSLACRLAQWAMAPEIETRLMAKHMMLPVLVEQDLAISDKDPEHPLLRAIRQQARVLIGEEDPPPAGLLRQLLKKRRVLVIIDGFSEMSEPTRTAVLSGVTDLPVNAVIITTRTDEQLGTTPKTEVKPLRVKGNRLATFMEAYLTARKKRDLFEDDEFFEACRRLSLIVGDRDITALLAKLYAEQMTAAKEGTADADAPENIPELMLSYLNDLSRKAGEDVPDIRVVHRAAKSVAWQCLKKTLRPTPALREDVLLALSREGDGEALLKHLEERLRVIQTVGAGRDKIRFALDPLAEYLAGMYLVDKYREDERAWRNFLALVDEYGGATEDIRGFLLAARDCCLARGEEVQVLRRIADMMAQRAGISPEESNRYRVERRVKQLIPRLKYPEAKDRMHAAEELGSIGAPAKLAAEGLCRSLKDPDTIVRRSSALALGRVGEGAPEAVVEPLIGAVKDSDERVRGLAVDALIKLGSTSAAAVTQLTLALKDRDETTRRIVVSILGRIGKRAQDAIPLMVEALKDSDVGVRYYTAEALGRIRRGAEQAVPQLAEALKDPEMRVRQSATNALLNIVKVAEEAVITKLAEALTDPDEDVRERAAEALGRVGRGAERAVPQLTVALQDPVLGVRQRAEHTLLMLRILNKLKD